MSRGWWIGAAFLRSWADSLIGQTALPNPPQSVPLYQTLAPNCPGHRTGADSTHLGGIHFQGDPPSAEIASVILLLDFAARSSVALPFWVHPQPDFAGRQRLSVIAAEGYTGQGCPGRDRYLYEAARTSLASPLMAASPPGSINHLRNPSRSDIDTTAPMPSYYSDNPWTETLRTSDTPHAATPNTLHAATPNPQLCALCRWEPAPSESLQAGAALHDARRHRSQWSASSYEHFLPHRALAAPLALSSTQPTRMTSHERSGHPCTSSS